RARRVLWAAWPIVEALRERFVAIQSRRTRAVAAQRGAERRSGGCQRLELRVRYDVQVAGRGCQPAELEDRHGGDDGAVRDAADVDALDGLDAQRIDEVACDCLD